MHVVLIGARPEAVRAVAAGGHEITLLYEAWEDHRVRALASLVTRACVVDSPDILDSVWSALHHTGAIAGGIDAVIALAEYGVLPAAAIARHFGARSLDPEVALRCRDKAIQKAAWRAAGVPTASWVVLPDARITDHAVDDAIAAAGLAPPFVVKPPARAGGIQVALADDASALAEVIREHPVRRLMIEERNPGTEWHLDGVVEAGALTAFVVSPYLTPLIETKTGNPQCSITLVPDHHAALYEHAATLTRRALSALGLTDGVFHFEVFGDDPARWVAGELAARPGGSKISAVIERTIGVNMWAAATQIFTGDPILRAQPAADHTYGYAHLPSQPGRRNRVRQTDLERLPGVLEVQMTVAYDEDMPDMKRSTSTGVGVVVVEGRDFDDCRSRMADIAEHVAEINGTSARRASCGS